MSRPPKHGDMRACHRCGAAFIWRALRWSGEIEPFNTVRSPDGRYYVGRNGRAELVETFAGDPTGRRYDLHACALAGGRD